MDNEFEQEPARERRSRSPISCEILIDRIELARNFHDEAIDELDWSLYLHPVESTGYGSSNFLLTGHLFRVSEHAVAQVRANTLLRAYDSDDQPMNVNFVHEYLAHGFVELTYDACRRALEIQASNMDISLDLPKLSPAAVIALVPDGQDDDRDEELEPPH